MPKNSGRLKDRQIGRDRFHDLRWQGRIVKSSRELFCGLPQRLVVALPVIDQLFNTGKTAGIPRLIRSCDRRTAHYTTVHYVTIRGNLRRLEEIRFGSIPGETKRNRPSFTRRNREWNEYRRARG